MDQPRRRGARLGDYLALLGRLEEECGYQELLRQRATARSEGRLVGIGISLFNEISASGSADYRRRGVTSLPGTDAARVVVTAEGRVEIYTSAANAGQGHADTYRALAGGLGLRPEEVEVIEGDTALCPDGSGTFISRGAVGWSRVSWRPCAWRPNRTSRLAPHRHVHDPSQVYPCGAHLAVVEVDPVSLVPHVVRYVVIEDCGRVLDRDLVEGRCAAPSPWASGRCSLRSTPTPRTDNS